MARGTPSFSEIPQLLSSTGAIARTLSRFEERKEQVAMAQDVARGMETKKISLIEAGTGVGKSLAYLLPAFLLAKDTRKRIVISTHTIPLQEQLLNKDFPLLKKVLGPQVSASLVKGMHNYLCFRKIEDSQADRAFFQEEEKEQLETIEKSVDEISSLSELDFVPSPAVKDKVCCERESCTHHRCPYFEECHFFSARKSAEDAQILIVNHHLLLADLMMRADDPEGKGILPEYAHLIVDEAHHLESVAAESLAERVSKGNLIYLLGRILTEKRNGKRTGIFSVLREKILKAYPKGLDERTADLLYRMDVEVFSLRKELANIIYDSFEEIQDTLKQFSKAGSQKDWKLRVLPEHLTHPDWEQGVVDPLNFLLERLKDFANTLSLLAAETEWIGNDALEERLQGPKADLEAALGKLKSSTDILERFGKELAIGNVRWIEVHESDSFRNVHLVQASLNVAELLNQGLFQACQSVTLCSATLTTHGGFDFIKNRLGLRGNPRVKESCYQSPFDYKNQVLLGIPKDLPEPQSPYFLEQSVRVIEEAVIASQGNCFVLFTSFFMLRYCYDALEHRLKKKGLIPLKQGEESRRVLLERFRQEEGTVLFGTDSFWEGVDVVGDALRTVILAKLPFPVPSEPLVEAHMEILEREGQSSFFNYLVPQAIVKFKQGFGRLIRHKEDRGSIICLDTRLLTKGYGKAFLESLPACQQAFVGREALVAAVSRHMSKNGV